MKVTENLISGVVDWISQVHCFDILRPDDYKSELIRSQMKQVPAHFESPQRSVNDHRKISKNSSEDFESEQISYQEVAKSLLAVTLVFGGIFWYRKRQFDRKGYHKKRESDFGV